MKADEARWLEEVVAIAEAVRDLVRPAWMQRHDIRRKGPRDIVTEMDLAAEALVLRRLRESFPTHAITSEEAGSDAEEAHVRWYVDPIDGTTNFSRHNPNFSLSLAAVVDGEPLVGVVCDILRGHCFAARRGAGATLNGRPLHVAATATIEAAIFGIDWPREPPIRRRMWRIAGRLLERAQTLRTLGSAALMMSYVAPGWIDLYLCGRLHPWDQAAAALLVREAGGVLGTISGGPWHPAAPDPLIAATPALLEAAHRLIDEAEAAR